MIKPGCSCRHISNIEHKVSTEVLSKIESNLISKGWVHNHCIPFLSHLYQLLQSFCLGVHGDLEKVGLKQVLPVEQMCRGRYVRPMTDSLPNVDINHAFVLQRV